MLHEKLPRKPKGIAEVFSRSAVLIATFLDCKPSVNEILIRFCERYVLPGTKTLKINPQVNKSESEYPGFAFLLFPTAHCNSLQVLQPVTNVTELRLRH